MTDIIIIIIIIIIIKNIGTLGNLLLCVCVCVDFSLCYLINYQISNPKLVQVHCTTLHLAAGSRD